MLSFQKCVLNEIFVAESKNECFARVRKLKCDKDSLSNRINDTEKECAVLSSEIQELPNLVVEKNNEVQCLCQNLEQLKSAVADLTLGMTCICY